MPEQAIHERHKQLKLYIVGERRKIVYTTVPCTAKYASWWWTPPPLEPASLCLFWSRCCQTACTKHVTLCFCAFSHYAVALHSLSCSMQQYASCCPMMCTMHFTVVNLYSLHLLPWRRCVTHPGNGPSCAGGSAHALHNKPDM